MLSVHLALAWTAWGALSYGGYQTLPGSTVREWGDRVPNGSRIVPYFATLTFDLNSTPPALTAVITNAVLEGGSPFTLTVHSSSGSRLADGSYRFMGDYLGELYPSGTQYLFDWKFSTSTNGQVVWDGTTAWVGGHAWYVTISNITIVPVPWLKIARAETASAQIMWSTNFADFVLEHATEFPAPSWSAVTNAVDVAGDHLSVTLGRGMSNEFYRLRKP